LIKEIAGKLLTNTGTIYNTVLGNIDSTKGEFRKGNVSAGESYFENYEKVEPLTKKLAEELQKEMRDVHNICELLYIRNPAVNRALSFRY
jgi:hypothetical protein